MEGDGCVCGGQQLLFPECVCLFRKNQHAGNMNKDCYALLQDVMNIKGKNKLDNLINLLI